MRGTARFSVVIVIVFAFAFISALPQTTRKVLVNGLSFSYVEAGSGPSVIFIHGSISDHREWSQQLSSLARSYRSVAYSRRHHWPNGHPDVVAADQELQVEDLAAMIKALKLAPAHLVGHSYGGAVALHLTLRHPELVRSLVLLEPGIAGLLGSSIEDEAARKEGQATRAKMGDAFASGDPERIVRTYASHVAPGVLEKAEPEVLQMLMANASAFQKDYTSRRLPLTCLEVGRINIPVLVLAGELSPPGLRHIARTTANCLRSAEFALIPQSTHWITHDQSEKLNKALIKFLGRVPR